MSKSLSADVARTVRGILAERQIDVKAFAISAGLPPASVDRWLKRGGKFNVDALEAMAVGLGMTAPQLVDLAMGKRNNPPPGEERRTGT